MAARPEAVQSTADVAATLEQQALLVAAVGRLPEPLRSIVVLTYFDGRRPGEVARRLGLSLAVQRARHREALERLRSDLDRANRGDRSAWAVALVPLLRPGDLGQVGLFGTVPSAGAAAMWGGVAMGTKAMVALGVVACGALFFAGWTLRPDPEPPAPVVATAVPKIPRTANIFAVLGMSQSPTIPRGHRVSSGNGMGSDSTW